MDSVATRVRATIVSRWFHNSADRVPLLGWVSGSGDRGLVHQPSTDDHGAARNGRPFFKSGQKVMSNPEKALSTHRLCR